MNIKEITTLYLEALRKGNMKALSNLFSENGVVISPVYGTMPALLFYETLFKDTKESQLTLLGVFQDIEAKRSFAIHFTYQWTLANGNKVVFDVVDVVKLNDEDKIIELKIIYDTRESKPAVTSLRK